MQVSIGIKRKSMHMHVYSEYSIQLRPGSTMSREVHTFQAIEATVNKLRTSNFSDILDICDRIWEKGPFRAKRAFFCHFSNCYQFKVSSALSFWLGLLAVWTYFTDPTLQASCPEQWASKVRHKTAIFEHDQRALSPRSYRMWAGSTICCDRS